MVLHGYDIVFQRVRGAGRNLSISIAANSSLDTATGLSGLTSLDSRHTRIAVQSYDTVPYSSTEA